MSRGAAFPFFKLELGRTVQRAHTWRWTVPIVAVFFTLLTVLFVFVNIPLSAYELVQQFSTSPNDTSNAVPFQTLLPYLQSPTNFTAQSFRVGDTVRSNMSAFEYTITQINANSFGRTATALRYYNNPLSSCDVSNVTISLRAGERASIFATVACWSPAFFKMNLELNHAEMLDSTSNVLLAPQVVDLILTDAEYAFVVDVPTIDISDPRGSPAVTHNVTGMDLSLTSCCKCDGSTESYVDIDDSLSLLGPSLLDHPPCDDALAKFANRRGQVYYQSGADNATTVVPYFSSRSILPDISGLNGTSNFATALQNVYQAAYHFIRLDLGAIRDNQIYMNPDMFNQSIAAVALTHAESPNGGPTMHPVLEGSSRTLGTVAFDSFSNATRRQRESLTLPPNVWSGLPQSYFSVHTIAAQLYLRQVYQRKPIPQAVSAVFVSTFVMVLAVYIFLSLVAALYRSRYEKVPAYSESEGVPFGALPPWVNSRSPPDSNV